MSHECDGDCQATAEWRQQQIRDLTERLNRAKGDALREYAEDLAANSSAAVWDHAGFVRDAREYAASIYDSEDAS